MSGKKLIGAVLLLACALAFLGWRYRATKPPARPASPVGEAGRRDPAGAPVTRDPVRHSSLSEEQRNQLREKMFQELGLSAEQREKMLAFEQKLAGKSGRESWRETMDELARILTPEQMKKLEQTGAARDRRMAEEQWKVLPPEERAKLEKNVEEQMKKDGWQR